MGSEPVSISAPLSWELAREVSGIMGSRGIVLDVLSVDAGGRLVQFDFFDPPEPGNSSVTARVIEELEGAIACVHNWASNEVTTAGEHGERKEVPS